jgi:hypothetical protein
MRPFLTHRKPANPHKHSLFCFTLSYIFPWQEDAKSKDKNNSPLQVLRTLRKPNGFCIATTEIKRSETFLPNLLLMPLTHYKREPMFTRFGGPGWTNKVTGEEWKSDSRQASPQPFDPQQESSSASMPPPPPRNSRAVLAQFLKQQNIPPFVPNHPDGTMDIRPNNTTCNVTQRQYCDVIHLALENQKNPRGQRLSQEEIAQKAGLSGSGSGVVSQILIYAGVGFYGRKDK